MAGGGFKQPLQSALVGGRQGQGQFYTVELTPFPFNFSEYKCTSSPLPKQKDNTKSHQAKGYKFLFIRHLSSTPSNWILRGSPIKGSQLYLWDKVQLVLRKEITVQLRSTSWKRHAAHVHHVIYLLGCTTWKEFICHRNMSLCLSSRQTSCITLINWAMHRASSLLLRWVGAAQCLIPKLGNYSDWLT